MNTYQSNPLDSLLAKTKDNERSMSLVEYIEKWYGVLDQGSPRKEFHEDDQHSLSSHKPSTYEISDPKEAYCDDDVHLHEDKGLVSLLPF
jgi:hypothetical protein